LQRKFQPCQCLQLFWLVLLKEVSLIAHPPDFF